MKNFLAVAFAVLASGCSLSGEEVKRVIASDVMCQEHGGIKFVSTESLFGVLPIFGSATCQDGVILPRVMFK